MSTWFVVSSYIFSSISHVTLQSRTFYSIHSPSTKFYAESVEKNKKPRLFLFHFSSPSGVFKYSKWKTTNIMKSQAEKHFMKVDDKFRNAPSCKKQCIKKKILWKRSRSSSRNESKIKSLLPKFRIQMKKKICLKFSQL